MYVTTFDDITIENCCFVCAGFVVTKDNLDYSEEAGVTAKIIKGEKSIMKIIYIAYSCNPYQGSEDKFGWKIPYQSFVNGNTVSIFTKPGSKPFIEKFEKINNVKLNVYYIDIPKLCKKFFKGALYSIQLQIWNKHVFPIVKKLVDNDGYEIIHQINPIEFRSVGKYWKIKKAKFVCGPLGGGEKIPKGLRYYSRFSFVSEGLRTIANIINKILKKKALKMCDALLFANKETQKYCGFNNTNSICYSEVGCDEFDIDKKNYDKSDKIIFLTCGRLVYRKGIEFLLDAIDGLDVSLPFELRIVGGGRQEKFLKKKMFRNKNSSKISFVGKIPFVLTQEQYKNSDVFIFPSIRETTGSVILEAMALGLPVITIDSFGGALIVDENNGYMFKGRNRKEYIKSLRDIMQHCIENKNELMVKSEYAIKTASNMYWSNKYSFYNGIYIRLLKIK